MADGGDSLRLKNGVPALPMTGICEVVTYTHDVLIFNFLKLSRDCLCLNMAMLRQAKSAHTHTPILCYFMTHKPPPNL